MSIAWIAALAIVGAAIGVTKIILGAMFQEEARSRLERIPLCLIRLAGGRVPADLREDLTAEWQAELDFVLTGTDDLPLTRLARGIRYSAGLLFSARTITDGLTHGHARTLQRLQMSRVYIAAVVIAATSLIASRLSGHPMTSVWWLSLGIIMLLFLICDSTPTPRAAWGWAWSPSSAATLAAVVLLGPLGAALVGTVSVLSLRRNLLVAERVFNGGMYAVSGFAAGWMFVELGGHLGLPFPGNLPSVIWPFTAAAAVYVFVNLGLMWGVLELSRRGARRHQLESSLPLLLASDLGYAALGLVIAALWTVMGPFAAALVLVPLFVVRWAMGRFAEQQRAYGATMAALSQAVETKDFHNR
jgi:hypothetical protein